jgi:hypothetical protein
MSGAKRIWQFINNVGANCIFASRELLHLCSRSTIDNTFSRLVKQGKLERLAAGIFIVAGGSGESPPVQAIVAVKARAFSKRAHANTTGNPEKTEKEKQEVFLTDGCKGSFRSFTCFSGARINRQHRFGNYFGRALQDRDRAKQHNISATFLCQ